MTTIELKAYQAPVGKTYTATTSDYKHGRITLTFNKSESRLPEFVNVSVAPRGCEGTWNTRENDGTIERMSQTKDANGCVVVTGMWSEDGTLSEMTIRVSPEVSALIP